MRCSLAERVWSSNGLVTKPSAPAAMPRPTNSGSCSVVQNTTLGRAPPAAARNAVMNSIPVITGMFQSSRIRSGMAAWQRASASWPFSASVTRKPRLSTTRRETERMTRESSTIRQLRPSGEGACATPSAFGVTAADWAPAPGGAERLIRP